MLATTLMVALLNLSPTAPQPLTLAKTHPTPQSMGETCTKEVPCMETSGARYYITRRGHKRYIRPR